jgi:hypothetical protein
MSVLRGTAEAQFEAGAYEQTVKVEQADDFANVYITMIFPTYPNPGGTGFWRYYNDGMELAG